MYLIPLPQSNAVDLLPQLEPKWAACDAANDTGAAEADYELRIRDINLLVAEVAGRVAARADVGRADIELDLTPCVPEIAGDPRLTAFAIAGVLVAQLHSVEDGGAVRIRTEANAQTVKVSILSDALPLLDFIRAIEADDGDPTMIHCRRLIEQVGGWMQLRADQGLVGFELNLPALPRTVSTGMQAPLAFANRADAAQSIALAS